MVYKLFDKTSSGANTLGDTVTCAQSETLTIRDKFAIKSEVMAN